MSTTSALSTTIAAIFMAGISGSAYSQVFWNSVAYHISAVGGSGQDVQDFSENYQQPVIVTDSVASPPIGQTGSASLHLFVDSGYGDLTVSAQGEAVRLIVGGVGRSGFASLNSPSDFIAKFHDRLTVGSAVLPPFSEVKLRISMASSSFALYTPINSTWAAGVARFYVYNNQGTNVLTRNLPDLFQPNSMIVTTYVGAVLPIDGTLSASCQADARTGPEASTWFNFKARVNYGITVLTRGATVTTDSGHVYTPRSRW